MLKQEQNDLLTRTGPETPMGRLFCCYWVPALLAVELPENECPPVRVKLLGERLPAWRRPCLCLKGAARGGPNGGQQQ